MAKDIIAYQSRNSIKRIFDQSPFNDKEKLVGKMIILLKMQNGLKGRTIDAVRKTLEDKIPLEFSECASLIIDQSYQICYDSSVSVYKEVAKSLGVDNKKYNQICDWVYSHNTNL